MRIGVNVRLLIKNRIDGISRFTYETLRRITVAHPEHRFIFYFDRKFSEEFIFSSNIEPLAVPPQTRRPFLNDIWTCYTLPVAMWRTRPDIFVSTDGLLPLSAKIPCLPVIHDLNFVHHPEWLPAYAARYYNTRYPRYAGKATRIATVSEFSKSDIAQTYQIDPSRIDVIYNGVSERFKPVSNEQAKLIRNKFAGGDSYFLFVGSVHPRKNLEKVMLAYEIYRSKSGFKRKLIIAGEKYFGNEKLDQIHANMQFKGDVVFTGQVNDASLVDLYGSAHTFVYPTLFEGFGIPVLEAMNSRVPVIASNTTALPEVCGDAAYLVNPDSQHEIAHAMLEMDQEQIREKYINLGVRRAAEFSWDRSAELFWNSIEQTIQS